MPATASWLVTRRTKSWFSSARSRAPGRCRATSFIGRAAGDGFRVRLRGLRRGARYRRAAPSAPGEWRGSLGSKGKATMATMLSDHVPGQDREKYLNHYASGRSRRESAGDGSAVRTFQRRQRRRRRPRDDLLECEWHETLPAAALPFAGHSEP